MWVISLWIQAEKITALVLLTQSFCQALWEEEHWGTIIEHWSRRGGAAPAFVTAAASGDANVNAAPAAEEKKVFVLSF